MRSDAPERDDGLLWDIASPARSGRVPGVAMAGFIDRGVTPPALRLIPHPSVTLLVVFGGTVVMRDVAGSRRQGSFVTGLGFGGPLRALRVDGLECLQVRLSPMVVRAVLGVPTADLNGVVTTLDDLLGRQAARLGEQLSELPTWEQRFALAEAWIGDRCAAAASPSPEVAWAWRGIVADRGMVRIEHLAAELGWSRKRLWTRFQSQIGLPPKRAARLVRFDHAVHGLVAGHEPAAVAARDGYADQSHLHRDVVEYTGLTPGTVAAEPFLAVDEVAWGRPGRRRV